MAEPHRVRSAEEEDPIEHKSYRFCIEALLLKNDPQPFILEFDMMCFIDQNVPADLPEQRTIRGIMQCLIKDLRGALYDDHRNGP